MSTHGILAEHDRREVGAWIDQLVEQEFLKKVGEYSTLAVPPEGRRLLRGEVVPQLLKPAERRRESKASLDSWQGVDRGLFDTLRKWRRDQAEKLAFPRLSCAATPRCESGSSPAFERR